MPGWIGWVQWGVILACFYVIYYRLPEPHLFDRQLRELFDNLESIMQKQDSILKGIAAAEHLDAPLVLLVRGRGEESEKWFVENHGSGAAINLWCLYGETTKSAEVPHGRDQMHLAASLRGGDSLLLPDKLVAKITASLAKTASIAEKTRDLAAEGYRYSDLYGDSDFSFEITFNFESAGGKGYSTTMTWSEGHMQVARNGYSPCAK